LRGLLREKKKKKGGQVGSDLCEEFEKRGNRDPILRSEGEMRGRGKAEGRGWEEGEGAGMRGGEERRGKRNVGLKAKNKGEGSG